MPRASITTSYKDQPMSDKSEAMHNKFVPAHERESGPWDDYELDSAGDHLDRAEKIKGNAKFVESIAKHHAKKSKHHAKLAEHLKPHMKRGLVSERQLAKAASNDHG